METIVAGRFDTSQQAQHAVEHLIANGFHHDETTSFFVNPPGQHGQFPIGGDQYADANSTKADVGAIAGAAMGGAAGAAAALAVPGVGVALALGIIGVGAYTGSLAGALARLGERNAVDTEASPGRPAGMLVAVRVLSQRAENIALDVLRQEGAMDIERQQGVWDGGEWKDFDPVAAPALVSEQEQAPTRATKTRSTS